MRRWSALALFALVGCQTVPERVEVAVPVPCVVALPRQPDWATAALAPDAGIWDQVRALLAERLQARGYLAELEAAARSCS